MYESTHVYQVMPSSFLLQDLSLSAKGKKQQMELSKGIQKGASLEKPLPSIIMVLIQSPPPVLCKLSSRQDTRRAARQGHGLKQRA